MLHLITLLRAFEFFLFVHQCVATDHDLSDTLEENIMNQGAMDVLISNNACTATSHTVKGIICMYYMKSCKSQPYHQHQNYTEYCVGHIKDVMNHIVTFTGALNNLWLLCLMYVVYILNITANSSIGDISPHHHSYGQTPNISPAFVSDSMSQSTTLVLILFMPLLRKRGDGLVLPLTSGIFSPFESLRMTPITLYIALLYTTPLFSKKRTFILNSPKGRMMLQTSETSSAYSGYRVR